MANEFMFITTKFTLEGRAGFLLYWIHCTANLPVISLAWKELRVSNWLSSPLDLTLFIQSVYTLKEAKIPLGLAWLLTGWLLLSVPDMHSWLCTWHAFLIGHLEWLAHVCTAQRLELGQCWFLFNFSLNLINIWFYHSVCIYVCTLVYLCPLICLSLSLSLRDGLELVGKHRAVRPLPVQGKSQWPLGLFFLKPRYR